MDLLKTKRDRSAAWVVGNHGTVEDPQTIPAIEARAVSDQDQQDGLESSDSLSADRVSLDESEDRNATTGDDNTKHDPSAYLQLVLRSPVYQWFLAALRREVLLNLEESSSMVTIAKKIASFLPRDSISTKRSVHTFQLTFHIPWDPVRFIEEQQYREHPQHAIYRAITLTGTSRNAQALTTAQYLLQTWPTTGRQILQLIQSYRSRGTEYKSTMSVSGCVLLERC